MENARRRFGFYDVRKRSKSPDTQKLLWTGIVFTREDDVQKVKQILKDEVGAVKPLFEDVEDTGDKKFHLANIVGRAKQRRWADAFVRFDLEREGSLPADKVFEIIRGRKYDHCLGVQVPLAQLEEQWDEMFPEVDRVVDSLTYAEYEEFVMEVSDSFEKDNGENAFFREKRKQQLRETYEADLINMFNRYDWDKSNSLEVKEVWWDDRDRSPRATQHVQHTTRRTTHATRHTPHATRHTPHAARHPPRPAPRATHAARHPPHPPPAHTRRSTGSWASSSLATSTRRWSRHWSISTIVMATARSTRKSFWSWHSTPF